MSSITPVQSLSMRASCPRIARSHHPRPLRCRTVVAMSDAPSWRQRERRITFQNPDGERLVGSLVAGESAKTVVLCHGFSDHRDTPLMLSLAAHADAASLSSFRFDFSGNGDSEGTFEFGNYWKEVEDIRAAVRYLRNEDLEISGLVGKCVERAREPKVGV